MICLFYRKSELSPPTQKKHGNSSIKEPKIFFTYEKNFFKLHLNVKNPKKRGRPSLVNMVNKNKKPINAAGAVRGRPKKNNLITLEVENLNNE